MIEFILSTGVGMVVFIGGVILEFRRYRRNKEFE